MAVSTTRATLRQTLGFKFGGELYVTGDVLASPSPTTSTFALAELVDSGADTKRFVDRWMYLASGTYAGQERRITAYTPGTGLITLHRVLAGAPSSGDDVEIHRWPPSMLHAAINRALTRCKYRDIVKITPVANQTRYSLAAYTYPETEKDVVNVWLYDYPAVGQGYPREAPWFKVHDDAGTMYLYVTAVPATYANSEIWLEIQRPYASLATDAATTTAPAEWVLAGAEVEMYNMLIERTGPGRERERLTLDRNDARRRFRGYSRQYQANYPMKLNLGSPTWGFASIT